MWTDQLASCREGCLDGQAACSLGRASVQVWPRVLSLFPRGIAPRVGCPSLPGGIALPKASSCRRLPFFIVREYYAVDRGSERGRQEESDEPGSLTTVEGV